MEDKELVKQVLGGNHNAFRFLVAKHQRLVMHVVGRIINRHDALEDTCQEVFIKVYKTLHTFRGHSKLSTWVATIAYNTALSELRKQKRRNEVSYSHDPLLLKTEETVRSAANPLECKEARKYLLQLIEKLPVHYRTVLTLYHLEEFSYKEIVEITGMPEGTIKSYLSRARAILKSKIEKVARLEQINIFENHD